MTPSPHGGVLRVDKPVGPTSHDVVARARRSLRERRVGHTGTLDPFASGLLLLCVGPATRLSPFLTGMEKEYLAEMRLGVETDTLDPEGEVVAESDEWRHVTPGRLEEVFSRFRGEVLQVPPAFSAKKIRGEAAHRRARRGEEVELEPATVRILELEVEDVQLPLVRFRVACSTGTYIRALARDVGRALGVGAHLTALRRTRVGPFSVRGAVSGDFPEDIPDEAWLTPLEALPGWPVAEVDAESARRIGHGQRVPVAVGDAPEVAVSAGGELLAVGSVREGVLHPSRVFPQALESLE